MSFWGPINFIDFPLTASAGSPIFWGQHKALNMETVKRPRGRPPLPVGTTRDARIMVRLTDEEYAAVSAVLGGKSISTWARDVLVAAARSC